MEPAEATRTAGLLDLSGQSAVAVGSELSGARKVAEGRDDELGLGDGFCLADTNFDRFQVLDAAGTHRASFTISEVLGLPRGFTQTMVAGPGGLPHVLTSVTDGGTTFGYVARLEATG